MPRALLPQQTSKLRHSHGVHSIAKRVAEFSRNHHKRALGPQIAAGLMKARVGSRRTNSKSTSRSG